MREQDQIVERVARLIREDLIWDEPAKPFASYGEEVLWDMWRDQSGARCKIRDYARRVVEGLGLREEHAVHPRCPEDTWMGGPYRCCVAQLMTSHCEHERAETRLATDWQKDVDA